VKKPIIFLLCMVVLFSTTYLAADSSSDVTEQSFSSEKTAYNVSTPFRINSNAQFATMAAARGWPGDGSQATPYIIDNYDINGAGYGYCIYIGNTTVNVTIINCYLHNASLASPQDPYFYQCGLILNNAKYAKMEATTATYNIGHGCYLRSSDSNTITNNTISSNGKNGIHLYNSDTNSAGHNTVSSNNDSGIFILSYSNGNELDNNSIESNKGSGIVLASNWWYGGGSTPLTNFTNSNIITYNTISSNYFDGVTLYQSGDNTITNNTISSIGGTAIQLLGCDYNRIENNILSGESEYTNQIFSTDGHYEHYQTPFVPYSTCGFISPEAIYIPTTDCTYIVYFNWSFETYIVEYSHATDTFSEPVLIGVNPSFYNDHCMPAISIDNDGYIYVFYGQRQSSGVQFYKNSTNPYDITQWSAQKSLGVSTAYSYPQVWNYPVADKIIYIAHDYGTGRLFMTDSNNWSSGAGRINLLSTGTSYMISAMDSNNYNIHLAWSYYLQNGNVYYMNSSNGGKTWYTADGTYLGEPSTGGPIPESQALAFTVTGYNCKCQVISGNINFDSSGNPLIAFYVESGGANNPICQYKLARWDDSDWVISNISNGQGHVCILTDNDTAYRVYCTDCVNRYNIGAIGSGPMVEYISTNSGANWTWNRTIAGGASASPVRVYNAKSDKSLEFTFGGGSFAGNVNAWGQSKSQVTSTSTRPIGILLDACDLRTNPDDTNGNYAHIQTSSHNTIANNTISNTSKGIALCHACTDNTIYHNYIINNAIQAFDNTVNDWDNGYPSGGNYWSDYIGIDAKNGPLQDQPGSDGIGDTPYVIDIDSQDYYPLMRPWGTGMIYHAPIRINSNSEFDAAHGVTGGNGTVWAPWIIENYDINGTGYGYCIYVGNTTDYFTVQNCYLHEASEGTSKPFYADSGLIIYNVQNSTIIYNNASSNNWNGIEVYYSNRSIIANNTVFSNYYDGIYLKSTNGINISWNVILDNQHGVSFQSSNDNILSHNVAMDNNQGVYIYMSNDNIITNNVVLNGVNGIRLSKSSNNTLSNNFMTECGISISGNMLEYWNTHNIDTLNTVNGKSVIYLKNQVGSNIPVNAGQVILANCSNMCIENQSISNGSVGIHLGYSTNNIITNITILNNEYGLDLWYSGNNTIYYNNISNNGNGISLGTSYNNTIYHNNIITNIYQAYDTTGTNFWDNGYPYGGNYWSDYVGVDLNCTSTQDVPPPDGIGDTPYIIDADSQDNYPLMTPLGGTQYNISLQQGWNLISVPLIQPNEFINKVLTSIAGKWDIIQTYNSTDSVHWKSNSTFKPDSLNDLKTIDHEIGIWIHMTEPDVLLSVYGYIPTSTSIPLYAGWNLVGYPTLNATMTVGNALWGTGADRVEVCDPTDPYRTKEVSSSYLMKPGEGYWVHVQADTIWLIDW
jgi:parallel beta-helix repeat protein